METVGMMSGDSINGGNVKFPTSAGDWWEWTGKRWRHADVVLSVVGYPFALCGAGDLRICEPGVWRAAIAPEPPGRAYQFKAGLGASSKSSRESIVDLLAVRLKAAEAVLVHWNNCQIAPLTDYQKAAYRAALEFITKELGTSEAA